MPDVDPFLKKLEPILESTDLFSTATERLGDVEATNQELRNKQSELDAAIAELNAQLAGVIRRRAPKLDVWLDTSGCVRVRYGARRRSLTLRPDVHSHSWQVGDASFEQQFRKYFGEVLSGSPGQIADAIAQFFRSSYKTLGRGQH